MLRPNLAQDAPPTEIMVGGVSYKINVDFRVWIDVMHDLRNLIPAPITPEHALHNAETIAKVEKAVFGHVIKAKIEDILAAITEFAAGYPEAPIGEGSGSKVQTYSLEWDLNYIIIAIMNQFGIDLTYRRKEPFHFWEFLVYFRALCGDHYILRLMEIRGYDGKDAELKRQAQRFALPREETAEDQALSDVFNDIFYNA
jgi:hypothetical protein